jgi:hypothetical protein
MTVTPVRFGYDLCMQESLPEMLAREPFQPFRIILTSGDGFTISDPALAVLMESLLFLAELRSDRFHLLRWNQIAGIEAISAAA